MSAIQSSSSLLSRTRSTRAHVAGAPTKLDVINNASPTTLSTTSNVALFLTNLRLLDLDLLPDWPGISSLTFSARDAAQGQRKRIQSVEWALYQLFVLWDAEDARNACAAPLQAAVKLALLTHIVHRNSNHSFPRSIKFNL